MPRLDAHTEQKIAIARQTAFARAGARSFSKQAEYLAIAALLYPPLGVLRLLPVNAASHTGAWLGRHLLSRILPLHRAMPTLAKAFPELEAGRAREILVGMCENMGRIIAELVHLDAFRGPVDHDRLTLIGLENLESARSQGHGILVLGGHFANWEVLAVALRNAGIRGAMVLHTPSNPYLVGWLARQRYRCGLDEQIAQGSGVAEKVFATLTANRAVQILADQHVGKGIAVPFFGEWTGTNALPARAALELGTPIVCASVRRVGTARFTVRFHPPLPIVRSGDDAADELAIMSAVNRFYEAELRARPEHWLWLHRRWPDSAHD